MGINYFTCNVTEVCRVTDNQPSPMKQSIRGLRNIATELCCTDQEVIKLEREHALGELLYKKDAAMRLVDVERAKLRYKKWCKLPQEYKDAIINTKQRNYIDIYWEERFHL